MAIIVSIVCVTVILCLVYWCAYTDLEKSTLKKMYMRIMKQCCANCKHYNKETGYCTVIIPSVRVWHEVTGWFNTEEIKDTKKADYRIGKDNCHWEKKENNG